MKKLRQIITQIRADSISTPDELNDLLWQLICYSPKMPLRLQQEQLLNEAEKFSQTVKDDYFAEKELVFNGFKWGNGSRKLLLTHGWGSKAADFMEIINALKEINDLEIIAFDAPSNGSSEGELSNLLLFIQSIEAITLHFGEPDILVGHSLGAMANMIALSEMKITPSLLISIAPLIRLKENFEYTMNIVGVPQMAQDNFFKSFEEKFNRQASHYNLIDWYILDKKVKHWLAYDENDHISTYNYLKEFLDANQSIVSQKYEGVGHERMIKSAQVINDLVEVVKASLIG
ncbi:MAG TPA: alpha/beta hydrolase [Chitinophagaceae bacterium]|nr:alpha/beta hydrolase [Chitinophagaceae bacterium]